MAVATLRSEERTGLIIAFLLHVALVAALVLQPRPDAVVPLPERMTVSLADEVALEATGPVLSQDSRQAVAPTISDEIAPPERNEPEPAPEPKLQPQPRPEPTPRPAPRAKPDPAPAPKPRPEPRPQAKAAPKASTPAPSKTPPAQAEPKKGGGSRIGADFLKGTETGRRDAAAPAPASAIGAAEKASLAQAIARQLKPHWTSPQGVDVELLVTVLSFDLKADGSLAGTPRVVRQEGITDANRPQAPRHAELAVRAVQLAAPFDLPPEYYNAWKRVTAFRFDRKLSQ